LRNSRRGGEDGDGTIDLGDLGGGSEDDAGDDFEDVDMQDAGEEEVDKDVEPMDIGPPATEPLRKMSVSGGALVGGDEEDVDAVDDFEEMVEEFERGETSEESEEE
jgi:hypothetical protein